MTVSHFPTALSRRLAKLLNAVSSTSFINFSEEFLWSIGVLHSSLILPDVTNDLLVATEEGDILFLHDLCAAFHKVDHKILTDYFRIWLGGSLSNLVFHRVQFWVLYYSPIICFHSVTSSPIMIIIFTTTKIWCTNENWENHTPSKGPNIAF